MHEVSLVHAICTAVADAAAQHGLGRVDLVRLIVGRERLVCLESLQFAFALLKPAPLMAGARLEIEECTGSEFLIDAIEGERLDAD